MFPAHCIVHGSSKILPQHCRIQPSEFAAVLSRSNFESESPFPSELCYPHCRCKAPNLINARKKRAIARVRCPAPAPVPPPVFFFSFLSFFFCWLPKCSCQPPPVQNCWPVHGDCSPVEKRTSRLRRCPSSSPYAAKVVEGFHQCRCWK
jgi:hypothetical protein